VDIKEAFVEILENGDKEKFVSLLKSLTPVEKKSLTSIIKKIQRDYRNYFRGNRGDPSSNITKKLIDSDSSREVLEVTSFICSKSYEEFRRLDTIPSLELLEETVLSWYQPVWLNRYFLEIADFYFDYQKMLAYREKGWLSPTKQFIADKAAYGLLESKEKLDEHIWYLFEHYTTIANDERWIHRFKQLIKEGDISRYRVLKECLLTANRGFNKPFTGWFFTLLASLEPSDEELLSLQNELIQVLDAPHSRPVADALKYIRRIMSHRDFLLSAFIDKFPILIVSPTKGIVTATLTMIDTVMKNEPKYRERLAVLVADALICKDEKIQTKAVKILQKYLGTDSPESYALIEPYKEMLFHRVQEMIPSLETDTSVVKNFESDASYICSPLEFHTDIDTLTYFYTQFFYDKKSLTTFDDFFRHFIALHQAIDEKTIGKCKLLFEQLLKQHEYTGTLIELSQSTLLNYLLYRLKAYGYHDYIETLIADGRLQPWQYELSLSTIVQEKSPFYFYFILQPLQYALEQLKTPETPVLLCGATYRPTYIASEVYEKRLVSIKEQGVNVPSEVYEIASAKCCPKREDQKISVVWEVVREVYQKSSQGSTEIEITLLKLDYDKSLDRYHYFRGYLSYRETRDILLWMPNRIDILLLSLIQQVMRCSTYAHQLLYESKHQTYTSKTGNVEMIQAAIDVLSLINIDSESETTHLFLSAALVYENQTIRAAAVELWHKTTINRNMNHQLLGEILGKLEHNEYAPLKRFSDLIVSNMLNLSSLHNEGLHTLLSAMITQMNDEPIKGTKKLLEIYLEVLALTGLSVPKETRRKLEVWAEVKSLKGVLKKLLA